MLSETAKIPSIGIIGRSKAGKAMAHALEAKGTHIVWFPGHLASAGNVPPKELGEANQLLLAVPDRFIASTAAALSQSLPQGFRVPVLHLSGSLTSMVLAPLSGRGISCGSCHPMQTMARPDVSLEGITFGIEGHPKARRAAAVLVRWIGGHPVMIHPERKALYHLAASLAGNAPVALIGLSALLLETAGFTEKSALKALSPLALTALENALRDGPLRALTGPVARGDDDTIERQKAALFEFDAIRLPLLEELVCEQRRLMERPSIRTPKRSSPLKSRC